MIPNEATYEEAVRLIADLVGDIIMVDELSLIKNDLVRVKVQARKIFEIKGDLQIFIGDQGYTLY